MPSPLGLVVEELNESLHVSGRTPAFGVRVTESTGPAHAAGIRQGDVITRLNNEEVDSVDTFNDVVNRSGARPIGARAHRAGPVADVPGTTGTRRVSDALRSRSARLRLCKRCAVLEASLRSIIARQMR